MKERDIENISAVINYIEAHLDSRLDLDTIARAASYSRYHLHRMFKKLIRHLLMKLISLSADPVLNGRPVVKQDIRPVQPDVKKFPIILYRILERPWQRAHHFFSEFIMCICRRHIITSFPV